MSKPKKPAPPPRPVERDETICLPEPSAPAKPLEVPGGVLRAGLREIPGPALDDVRKALRETRPGDPVVLPPAQVWSAPGRWEYRREVVLDAEWPDLPNQLGAEGWELVGVAKHDVRVAQRREVVEGVMGQTEWFQGVALVFKRPLP